MSPEVMSPEVIRALAAEVMNLGVDAPIEKLIRSYDMLAQVMPTEEERRACERIASTYQEALAHQTTARLGLEPLPGRPPDLRPGEICIGRALAFRQHTLDVYVLDERQWFRVMKVPVDALPLFKPGVHLALVLGTSDESR
jgi:hypothetical protein